MRPPFMAPPGPEAYPSRSEMDMWEYIHALERYVQVLGDNVAALSRVVFKAEHAEGDDAPPRNGREI